MLSLCPVTEVDGRSSDHWVLTAVRRHLGWIPMGCDHLLVCHLRTSHSFFKHRLGELVRPAKEWSEGPEAFPENFHTNPENQLVIIVLAYIWPYKQICYGNCHLGSGGGKNKSCQKLKFTLSSLCAGAVGVRNALIPVVRLTSTHLKYAVVLLLECKMFFVFKNILVFGYHDILWDTLPGITSVQIFFF